MYPYFITSFGFGHWILIIIIIVCVISESHIIRANINAVYKKISFQNIYSRQIEIYFMVYLYLCDVMSANLPII